MQFAVTSRTKHYKKVIAKQQLRVNNIESAVGGALTAKYVPAENENSESNKVECEAQNNFVF